jgi:hypothetical protein
VLCESLSISIWLAQLFDSFAPAGDARQLPQSAKRRGCARSKPLSITHCSNSVSPGCPSRRVYYIFGSGKLKTNSGRVLIREPITSLTPHSFPFLFPALACPESIFGVKRGRDVTVATAQWLRFPKPSPTSQVCETPHAVLSRQTRCRLRQTNPLFNENDPSDPPKTPLRWVRFVKTYRGGPSRAILSRRSPGEGGFNP